MTSDEIAALLKAARRDERPPESVFEKLEARLASGAPVATAPARPLLPLACATCSGGLEEAVYCASCLAPHHEECFTACTVCNGQKVVSARAPQRPIGALLLVGAACVAAIIMIQKGYDEILAGAHHDQSVDPKDVSVKRVVAPEKPKDRTFVLAKDEELEKALTQVGESVSHLSSESVPEKNLTTKEPDDNGPIVLLELNGIISGPKGPVCVINGVNHREGDEVLGRDRKSFSPRRFVAKIGQDEVAIAEGSLDGPRSLLLHVK